MISKEIEELARERRQLETEVAQKEADVRIKGGEVRSLQVNNGYIGIFCTSENCFEGDSRSRLFLVHFRIF